MKHTIYGEELHTIVTQDEVKMILSEKYGFPVENISVSGAEMWCTIKLNNNNPVNVIKQN